MSLKKFQCCDKQKGAPAKASALIFIGCDPDTKTPPERVSSIKQVLPTETRKVYGQFCSCSFCILSGSSIIAFLWEECGTRSVTEGARVT